MIIDTCFLCNGEFTYDDNESYEKKEFKYCEKKHIYCEKCIGVLNRQYNMSVHKDINLICPLCRYSKQKNNLFFNIKNN